MFLFLDSKLKCHWADPLDSALVANWPMLPGCWRLSALLKGTPKVALRAGQSISHFLSLPNFLDPVQSFELATVQFLLSWYTVVWTKFMLILLYGWIHEDQITSISNIYPPGLKDCTQMDIEAVKWVWLMSAIILNLNFYVLISSSVCCHKIKRFLFMQYRLKKKKTWKPFVRTPLEIQAKMKTISLQTLRDGN